MIEAGGWGGAETLDGGVGNDAVFLFLVDATSDIVLDMSQPGLTQTLANGTVLRNFEALGLNAGDGNDRIIGGDLGNALYGNWGNDWLIGGDGHDEFEGGQGRDTMKSGGGRDDFYIGTSDGARERDVTDGGGGLDTLHSFDTQRAVDISLADTSLWQTLGDGQTFRNIEALEMGGSSFADRIIGGIGRDVLMGDDGDDTLGGGSGDDTLDGESGNDRLFGGDGNDHLTVWGDPFSAPGEADLVDGGAGDDLFEVSLGQHTLTGGAGADRFQLFSSGGLGSFGQITDFATEDRLILGPPPGLPGGPQLLAADAFVLGTTATGAEDRVLYDTATGTLRYDIDGVGGAAAVVILTLVAGTVITADNFLLA